MYHLVKKSRIYKGRPYCGPASGNMPAEYKTLAEALAAKERLTAINPVGWDIYEVQYHLVDEPENNAPLNTQ